MNLTGPINRFIKPQTATFIVISLIDIVTHIRQNGRYLISPSEKHINWNLLRIYREDILNLLCCYFMLSLSSQQRVYKFGRTFLTNCNIKPNPIIKLWAIDFTEFVKLWLFKTEWRPSQRHYFCVASNFLWDHLHYFSFLFLDEEVILWAVLCRFLTWNRAKDTIYDYMWDTL